MLRLPQCPASVARRIAPMSAVSRTRFVKAFPNWVVTLHRTTGKQTLRPNEYVFKVPPEMTKFDIRQYLEKLYSVKVEAISTVRTDAQVKRHPTTFRQYRTKREKRAYVLLAEGAESPADWRLT